MASPDSKRQKFDDGLAPKKDYDSDSDEEIRKIAAQHGISDAWPRFLIVEGTDPEKPLSALSPFAVEKGFSGVSSEFKNIRRLRNGTFLVECPSERASNNLRRRSGKIFVDRPIRVSAHRTLNSTKGVFRCRELRSMSEAEICKNLTDQGVTEIHRVTVRKGIDREPTGTYFVTFCVPKLPEALKIGYMRVKVLPYVLSPMRCFRCHLMDI